MRNLTPEQLLFFHDFEKEAIEELEKREIGLRLKEPLLKMACDSFLRGLEVEEKIKDRKEKFRRAKGIF